MSGGVSLHPQHSRDCKSLGPPQGINFRGMRADADTFEEKQARCLRSLKPIGLCPTGHTFLPGPTAPTPANSRSPASPGTRRRPTHRTYTPDGRSWATSRTPTQRSTQRTRLGVAADRAQTSTPALTTRYTALRYTPRLPAVDAALTVDAAPAAPAARAASNPLPNERLARRPRARPHQRHRVSGTGAAVHVRSPRQWPCARRNKPAAHGPWRNT